MSSDLVLEVIRDRELEEVTGDPLVAKDGARVLDRGADVEVAALRIIRGDEIEAARVSIVDAWRIHETAWTGRLEGVGKLADQERAKVRRQRDEPFVLKELDHLLLATLISLEEGLLIGRDTAGALRSRLSERPVGQEPFPPAVPRPCHPARVRTIV